MSLKGKSEYNDGSGEICSMLILNQINTIIDILCLNDEHIPEMFKSISSNWPEYGSQYLNVSLSNFSNTTTQKNAGTVVLSHWDNGY